MTSRIDRFCFLYALYDNKTKAYKEAYAVTEEDPRSSCSAAIRILKVDENQERYQYYKNMLMENMKKEVEKKFSMTVDDTMIAIQNVCETAEKPMEKLKGYELIGKHLGAFVEKIDANVNGTVEMKHVRVEVPINGRAMVDLNDEVKDG